MQADFVQCDCAGGVQNATHLWFDCSHTDHVRADVCAAAARVVDVMAGPAHRQWWDGLAPEAQLRHVVSSHGHMGAATEKAVRAACVPLVVSGLRGVLGALATANASFYSDIVAFAG